MRKAEKEQQKTKIILRSIINTLNSNETEYKQASNDELLGTLCALLSTRLKQDFSATTQNINKYIID